MSHDIRPIPDKKKEQRHISPEYWEVFFFNDTFYCEYDAGHFAPEFKTFAISAGEYKSLASGQLTLIDLLKKHGRYAK